MVKEARLGTYAANSEAWALSEALGRRVTIWGNDYATSLSVCCAGSKVLPYFDHNPATDASIPPIRIMQLCGGGHYQMLDNFRSQPDVIADAK